MPHELDQDVENFHRRQKLAVVVDLRTLIRGARIAQNPGNARMETVPGLTKAEESALDQEKSSNFFQQTKQLKVTILTTACAAIIQ